MCLRPQIMDHDADADADAKDQEPIALVHAIRAVFNEYWIAVEDSGADEDDETRHIRQLIEDQFAAPVASIGEVNYMVALFSEWAGPGAHGAIWASRFVWMKLDYDDWRAIARGVTMVPHAWYELMWFLIGTIGIDYFAIVDTDELLSSEELEDQKQHYPFIIRLTNSSTDEPVTKLEIEDKRCAAELMARLVSQGALVANPRYGT